MGDGHDWDVWYNGIVIGNLKAWTQKGATSFARRIYAGGKAITATPCCSNPFYKAPK